MAELLIGLALILLSAVIYFQSGTFPVGDATQLNPGSFPKVIALALAILSIILVIVKIKELVSKRAEATEINRKEYMKELMIEYRLVFITFFSLLLYVFLMQFIGFIITTICFIIGIGLLVGPKKKKDVLIISITSVVVTLSTYLFFENVLHVRFPSGLFF
ncbi:tripartite tricarboxylate transporter TctB family protein [Planococcus salinus]|uniref:Tripartite tricarboxylate transporter TctB family protein n=1 Tax=Planococcus salinus TaxID=1848460 RepID=A0A3M8P8C2_9BACL|nr:tripartite tricarboxylate transporter TctB family protein [Planococcus salinus]RNF39888.1 tripartite tricarboxylate transporter TctB family protein [Planococcus salinus]